MTNKVETKVVAAAGGAGGGSVVGTFVLWLLGAWAWKAGFGADQVETALAAVPAPVSSAVLVLIGTVGALIAGYAAPHTERTPVELAAAYDARHD